MGEFSCKIQRRVGKNDKLFGSVSAHDIYELVKEAGFTISKSAVRLGKPIKSLGKHEVEIALENDVSATITVEVAAED